MLAVFCTLAMGLVWFTGCESGPTYCSVSGSVEFKVDGSVAQFGSVEFRSQTDPPVIARGKIADDGSYSVNVSGKNGTVEGTHTVVIIQVIGDSRTGKVIHNHGLEVAKKYSDHRTTDLEVEVKKGSSADLKLLVESKSD